MTDLPFDVRRICSQRSPAFTLIELLVVVAIIGLLVAIIIPSLSKAKEQSRRVVCQSNLHQFCIGLNAYAHSNQQVLPSGRSDMSNDEHTPVLATTKSIPQIRRAPESPGMPLAWRTFPEYRRLVLSGLWLCSRVQLSRRSSSHPMDCPTRL